MPSKALYYELLIFDFVFPLKSGNIDTWNSVNISGREHGSEFVYNLTTGEHIFTIRGRENGARLDKLTLIPN